MRIKKNAQKSSTLHVNNSKSLLLANARVSTEQSATASRFRCSPLPAFADINYATNAAVGKFRFPFSRLISIRWGSLAVRFLTAAVYLFTRNRTTENPDACCFARVTRERCVMIQRRGRITATIHGVTCPNDGDGSDAIMVRVSCFRCRGLTSVFIAQVAAFAV